MCALKSSTGLGRGDEGGEVVSRRVHVQAWHSSKLMLPTLGLLQSSAHTYSSRNLLNSLNILTHLASFMSAGGKQRFLRNCQNFVLDDTDHVLQTKVQEILQRMSSSSISWTKAELPFNVQKLPACQACNWLQSKTSWLPLPSKIVMCCIYFIRNMFYLFSSYYQMHVWVSEAILMCCTKSHLLWHLFSSLKWCFWKKIICPALTTLLCWPTWSTPSRGCVKSTAPDTDRQLPL